jgi:hypothetical protein
MIGGPWERSAPATSSPARVAPSRAAAVCSELITQTSTFEHKANKCRFKLVRLA